MYILINPEDEVNPSSIISEDDMEQIHEVGLSEWLCDMEVIDTETQCRFFNEFEGGKLVLKSQKLVDMRQMGYKPSLGTSDDIEDIMLIDFG